jgi:hypothetical protein
MEDIPIYGSILLVAGLAREDITKVLDAKSLDATLAPARQVRNALDAIIDAICGRIEDEQRGESRPLD